jgi:hypothetical protein
MIGTNEGGKPWKEQSLESSHLIEPPPDSVGKAIRNDQVTYIGCLTVAA